MPNTNSHNDANGLISDHRLFGNCYESVVEEWAARLVESLKPTRQGTTLRFFYDSLLVIQYTL